MPTVADVDFRLRSPCLAHVHSADQDLLRLLQSLSTTFHRGSSKPEVVVRHGSLCARRVFSTDGQCLRVAQSDSTLGHTKDRSGGPLPVCCRHGGKRRDWPSRTWDRSDSSKNPVSNTWYRSKRTPLSRMRSFEWVTISQSQLPSTVDVDVELAVHCW